MQFGYSSFGGFLHWGRSLQRSCLYQTFFIMMLLSLFLFLFTGRGASGVDSINRKFLPESFLSNAVFPCALASAASVRRDSNPIVRAENDSRHSKAPSVLSVPFPSALSLLMTSQRPWRLWTHVRKHSKRRERNGWRD